MGYVRLRKIKPAEKLWQVEHSDAKPASLVYE